MYHGKWPFLIRYIRVDEPFEGFAHLCIITCRNVWVGYHPYLVHTQRELFFTLRFEWSIEIWIVLISLCNVVLLGYSRCKCQRQEAKSLCLGEICLCRSDYPNDNIMDEQTMPETLPLCLILDVKCPQQWTTEFLFVYLSIHLAVIAFIIVRIRKCWTHRTYVHIHESHSRPPQKELLLLFYIESPKILIF